MTSSRSPDLKYNGSGYFDETAYTAIMKADRECLCKRKKSLIAELKRVAEDNGFRICNYIELTEIE